MEIAEITKDIRENLGIRRIKFDVDEEFIPKAKRNFTRIANEILAKKGRRFDIESVDQSVETFIRWIYTIPTDNLEFRKGLLFKGHTGRGKTFLFRVIRYFAQIDNIIYYENGDRKFLMPRIVNVKQIAGEYQAPDNKGGYPIIEKYSKFNCLVIDDIGKEQDENISFGNRLNVVEEIINIREEKGLLTFGTTNLEKMSPTYDDRTISRMYELFNVIPVDHDKDFRVNAR